MAILTSTEIVCVSGLSLWLHHRPVGSGQDELASGERVCYVGQSRSACQSRRVHIYMKEPHQVASRSRAIRWVRGNHVASLRNSFFISSFLCLLGIVFEDSHHFMGGRDIVNLDRFSGV